MINRIPNSFDWFSLGLFFLITVVSFYEAWENLINHRLSRFAFDAIAFFLIRKYGSKRWKQQARASKEDQKRIFTLGIYALLTMIGGVWAIIRWFNRYTLH